MRHLAAFWLVAVAGLCSYLRCATWLGARYYEGWLFGGMTSGCDGCIGPRLPPGADGISAVLPCVAMQVMPISSAFLECRAPVCRVMLHQIFPSNFNECNSVTA